MSGAPTRRYFGWLDRPADVEAIVSQLPMPSFGAAAPFLAGSGQGKVVLLHKSVEEVTGKPFPIHYQTIGDCFVAGTMVLGERTRPIEQVEVGDLVYTGEGNLTPVISRRAIRTNKPLVRIQSVGGMPITCTADHKMLVYRLARIAGKRVSRSFYERVINGSQNAAVVACYEARQPEWVSAEDLTDTDCLLTPLEFERIPVPESPGELLSSESGMFVAGYFLGNGHASGGSAEWSIPTLPLANRIARALEEHGYSPKISGAGSGRKAYRVRVHCVALVKWLRETFYDTDSVKSFPGWAIGNVSFLNGLGCADGHGKGDKKSIDSTSLSIVHGAMATLVTMGFEPTVNPVTRSKGTYANAKPLFRVTWRENKQKQCVWRDEQFVCRPVTKIELIEGPAVVYDIGVLDPHHSFIANGVAAHNCVSHGWGLGVDVLKCVQIAIDKRPEQWTAEAATEAIYAGSRVEIGGGRLGNGDGSLGAWAADWVAKYGIVPRGQHGSIDLSVYDGNRAKSWGGRGKGVPDELEPLAKEHPVKTVSLVKSYEEARDAIANGYPVPVCSMQGFASQRDSKGFAKAQGAWPHCVMPDALILGKDTVKAKDVAVGSLVFGRDGALHEVLGKHERYYSGAAIRIRTTGIPDMVVTAEHPVLVYRPTTSRGIVWRPEMPVETYAGGKYHRAAVQVESHSSTQPAYVQAKDLLHDDYLMLPRMEEAEPIVPEWPLAARNTKYRPLPIAVSDELAWMFGLYIAEGDSQNGHRVRFTLSRNDDVQRCVSALESLGFQPRLEDRSDKAVAVVVDSAIASRAFAAWFGCGASNKKIPYWLMTWSKSAVVEGIQHGDGGTAKCGMHYINTTSQVLSHQLAFLLASDSQRPIIQEAARNAPGRYPNASRMWRVEWRTDPKRLETRFSGNYYCLPVREVSEEYYDGPVFNYDIEGVQSYVADLATVHNCMLFMAVDDQDGRPGLLCMNSWGPNWISGPKRHDQPDGSFWVDADVATKMLRGGDSFAISNFEGYKRQRPNFSFT